jgi:predicted MFS family arabinose efflux permease
LRRKNRDDRPVAFSTHECAAGPAGARHIRDRNGKFHDRAAASEACNRFVGQCRGGGAAGHGLRAHLCREFARAFGPDGWHRTPQALDHLDGEFTVANVVASIANDYWELFVARILLACAAGLYVPSATALAGAIVAPERRGTALAVVNGGTSAALVLGVPLGAIVGNNFGWRATFVGVAVLAVIATIGLIAGLRRDVGLGLPVASVRERIVVARQTPVLLALLVTTLWATGAYTIYSYLAPYMASATGIEGSHLSIVLFMWGVAAVVGLFIGGAVSDAVGARAVMIPALLLLALAFASLSMSATFLSPAEARVPVFIAIIVWGVTAWGFFPAQQSHLIGVAGVKVASIVLSLNASFMYFGFSLGAALGSFTLIRSSVVGLGWVGAACEIVALVLVVATVRRPRPVRLSTAPGA